ncbi:MAG: biopolymer transporter ExbD [Nannocystaceae bacterium]
MAGGGHGRGKRTRRVPYKSEKGVHHEPPAAEINVTPLVDVCLVLLIIFMVVTPMLGRGKDVHLPKLTDASKHKEGDQVFVSINDDGAWIEQDLYLSKGDFLTALDESLKVASGKAAANGYKGPLLFLKGDKDTDYGQVRIVLEWITSSESMIQDVALVVDLEGE